MRPFTRGSPSLENHLMLGYLGNETEKNRANLDAGGSGQKACAVIGIERLSRICGACRVIFTDYVLSDNLCLTNKRTRWSKHVQISTVALEQVLHALMRRNHRACKKCVEPFGIRGSRIPPFACSFPSDWGRYWRWWVKLQSVLDGSCSNPLVFNSALSCA